MEIKIVAGPTIMNGSVKPPACNKSGVTRGRKDVDKGESNIYSGHKI